MEAEHRRSIVLKIVHLALREASQNFERLLCNPRNGAFLSIRVSSVRGQTECKAEAWIFQSYAFQQATLSQ